MLASELDYALPADLIAQRPLEPRDAARLMVLRRQNGAIEHRAIRDLPDLLRPDDLLVFNDTRVLRARLRGQRASGGRVEALLLKERAKNEWEALLKPSARLKIGQKLLFGAEKSTLEAAPIERTGESWIVRFFPPGDQNVRDLLPELGEVPLPPYIHEKTEEARYQTIFARQNSEGNPLDSAAAPTAGLHFTPQLLGKLSEKGVEMAFITLAVGAGTFRPVQVENLDDHPMHAEEFWIPKATSESISRQKARGARVVAVGTTTTRALESVADENGEVAPGEGETAIFIRPGYHFRCVDALLTNFHLPCSTLLALVAAFSGRDERGDLAGLEKIRYAYSQAITHRYRFFSFGDAMLIE